MDYIHDLPQLYPYDSASEDDSVTCKDSDIYALNGNAEDVPTNTTNEMGATLESTSRNDYQIPHTPNSTLAPLDIEGLAHVPDQRQRGLQDNSYVGDVMSLPKDKRMTRIYFHPRYGR